MEELLRQIRHLTHSLLARLSAALAGAPAGTLQVTGVLGLAAVLVGLYQLRGTGRSKQQQDRSRQDRQSGSQEASASRPASAPRSARSPSAPAHSKVWVCTYNNHCSVEGCGALTLKAGSDKAAGAAQPASSIAARLGGIRQITVSAPGVLLQEWTPSQLQEAATLRADAGAVVRDLSRAANVFIIAHVQDDVGEATVRGALEAGGLVGTQQGQIKPHRPYLRRVLFCSTLAGKVSMVRQLEPELHIDGHGTTIEELKRFMPQLLHICQPGSPSAGGGSPNVGSAPSLTAAFGK